MFQKHLEASDNEAFMAGESLPWHCSLAGVHKVLSDEQTLSHIFSHFLKFGGFCESVGLKTPKELSERATELHVHFTKSLMNKAEEEKSGIISTIQNYLFPFTSKEISEVFCPSDNTVDFDDIDKGMVLTVSLPQKYQSERIYINTIMKLIFYTHVLSRFDLPKKIRDDKNWVIFWADEAQNIVTSAEGGMADYNVLDKIRAAKATCVFAAQSWKSYRTALRKEESDVMLLNLTNRVILAEDDPEASETLAKIIGQEKKIKRNYGFSQGKGNESYSEEVQYHVRPDEIRKFRNFEGVVTHCQKGWTRMTIPPINPDGSTPGWYFKIRR
jgi:type IV secretory pathway TraG/TraD family ATPase VirD4